MLQCNIWSMDNRAIYTSLKTGKRIYLRPIRPQDSLRIRETIANLSERSRYYRFFSGMKKVPDSVLERLVAVDGVNHLAWGALDLGEHDLPAIGVIRVVRDPKSGVAELAIATLDAFHNTGLARILMAVIICDCLHAGIETMQANVLAENKKVENYVVGQKGEIEEKVTKVIDHILLREGHILKCTRELEEKLRVDGSAGGDRQGGGGGGSGSSLCNSKDTTVSKLPDKMTRGLSSNAARISNSIWNNIVVSLEYRKRSR